MAKMFYTLDEAAGKLGKSPDEVKQMVESGQLSEFRDRDQLMFKVEQVDMLADDGSEEDEGLSLADSVGDTGFELSLEDSTSESADTTDTKDVADAGGIEGSGEFKLDDEPTLGGSASFKAEGSGAGPSMGDSTTGTPEQSGISIFDEEEHTTDSSADTLVTEHGLGNDMSFDAGASGSGLLDLTREADDTSLGADFLDDIYSAEDSAAGVAFDGGGDANGDLFETTGAPSDVSGTQSIAGPGVGGPGMVAAEPYDGGWSGITSGVAAGMALLSAFVLAIVVFGIVGTRDNPLLGMFEGNMAFIIPIAAGAGLMIVLALVLGLIGKRG